MFGQATNRSNSMLRLPFFGLALAIALATAGALAASAAAIGTAPVNAGKKGDRLPVQPLTECHSDCRSADGAPSWIVHEPAENLTTVGRRALQS